MSKNTEDTLKEEHNGKHALQVIKICFKDTLKQYDIASMTERYNNGIEEKV